MTESIITVIDDKGEYKGRLVQWIMAIYRAMPDDQQIAVRVDLLRMAATENRNEQEGK